MTATPFLIAINAVVYFLEYFVYNSRSFSIFFGLNELFFKGAYWQLITTMFLHGSLMHILMNMAVLYQFGMLLERYLGSVKFLLLYIVGGVITSALSLSYLMFANVNLVGASGAISVLLGFMANLDRYSRKGLIIAILLMSFAPLLLGINIAWYAHLFGFAIGYLAAFLKVFR
ncbi:rhomboid family intramembrane serine protease [Campylobacter fetus subsp. venerealis]|uniref:rhomboid family intramembrane serine protease n=1 Tax=Campylobacter fetus TaxID=196 RepID=UPI0018E7034C|nr:rhomboid family intramembrane serine protease [Campylobacter fetus]QQF51683.1 rhomboid family intramembrane serine protease [Campylobacter fetus subsp. venerealis]